LANAASGKANEIETRDGKVITAPFAFEALYGAFTEGWRVPRAQSLLQDCGKEVSVGTPQKPFFASDLNQKDYQTGRDVCIRAGVKVDSLLNACTVDVAFFGRPEVARAYVNVKPPVAVGNPR
jgi:hypothetical protein